MTRPRAIRPVLASVLFVLTCLFSMGQASGGYQPIPVRA